METTETTTLKKETVEHKPSDYRPSDHDLIMTNEQKHFMWEQGSGLAPMSEDAVIAKLAECATSMVRIQHARMVNKGFYDTFTATRELLLDKVSDSRSAWIKALNSDDQNCDPLQFSHEYTKWSKILREHTVNFILKQLDLMHEELSEASSALRENNRMDDKLTDFPGIIAEIADVFIRGFDLAGFMGMDLGKAIADKIGYNASRPYMHGKDA